MVNEQTYRVLWGDFRDPGTYEVEATGACDAMRKYRDEYGFDGIKIQKVVEVETGRVYVPFFGWRD